MSSGEHGRPETGAECKVCYDDIDESNYVEFRMTPAGAWTPSTFCTMCVSEMLKSQFHKYKSNLEKSDCAKAQREMLARGPPVNLHDPHGFPGSEDREIDSLWFMSEGEKSAKLDGSLEGAERDEYWDSLRQFLIKNEKVEEAE